MNMNSAKALTPEFDHPVLFLFTRNHYQNCQTGIVKWVMKLLPVYQVDDNNGFGTKKSVKIN